MILQDEGHDDFYQLLRRRIASWLTRHGEGFRHSQILLLAPDLFHLLCRLAIDKRVPTDVKAKLAVAIAYFVSPIDLLPEGLIGPVGYLDDVAIAAYAISSIVNSEHGDIARELWAGDGDLLAVVQQILSLADQMIGAGLWQKIRAMFDGSNR
jgi:uncharacterized membrane protein YkvA (DUF1232 family)